MPPYIKNGYINAGLERLETGWGMGSDERSPG